MLGLIRQIHKGSNFNAFVKSQHGFVKLKIIFFNLIVPLEKYASITYCQAQ